MSNHTPGPWKVAADGKSVYAQHPSDGHQLYVASCYPTNACLIAAAPQLLAALKSFKAWEDSFGDGDTWDVTDEQQQELYERASDAIAAAIRAAEGEG